MRTIQCDTARIATGEGTGGSSSIPCGGASVAGATRKLAETLKRLAADALEAAPADLEIARGRVQVAGTDRAVTFADLMQHSGADVGASDAWAPDAPTYPNGTHVCEVEIDPQTGAVEIAGFSVVDDFGVTLNPFMLEGQIHGGAVQGLGQSLVEQAVFDEAGQLLTASLMDYALPRAAQMPAFAFETRNVPCRVNPLGVKGAGEAGAIGSCPAVMNAILDALWRHFRIAHLDMPATPERIWRAIRDARTSGAAKPAGPGPAGS